MSTRNTTIALTDSEKQRLDAAAESLFGTSSVPYGETVTELVETAVGDENDENNPADHSPV